MRRHNNSGPPQIDPEKMTPLQNASEKIHDRYAQLLKSHSGASGGGRKPPHMRAQAVARCFRSSLDMKLFTDELVRHCVVSVRSGWLVARVPRAFDRFIEFCALLAGLGDGDAEQLVLKCGNCTMLVRTLCKCKKEPRVCSEVSGICFLTLKVTNISLLKCSQFYAKLRQNQTN